MTSSISLSQLQFVCAVLEAGSFRKAAKVCRVSQPTLSVQIQQLEEELGVQVFDRVRRPLSVTAEGRKIIEQAKVILHETQKLRSIARDDVESTVGDLRLGVIATLTPYLMPRFAPRFVSDHPSLNLIVDELPAEEIYRRLDRRELDAAVVAGPVDLPQFSEFAICVEPFVGYFSRDHRLLDKERIRPCDLDLSETWLLTEGHCFRNEVLEICQARIKRDPASKRLWFESGSMETIREMVDAGEGYTLFPFLAVEQLVSRSGKARLRRFVAPEPHRQLSLIAGRHYHRKKLLSSLFAALHRSLPAELQSSARGSQAKKKGNG